MLIFAGCYERFLFGFQSPDLSSNTSNELSRKFTFAAHKNAVKCVAAAGPYLVSGGADDTIHLYDIKHNKDLGFLMNPGEGAIPCLELFTPASSPGVPSHMFSGSADGSICIWKAGGDWEHLKVMKGHKGAVNDLTVHPSGRLALSVARDGAIRMWNLVKGRCTYTAKLEAEGDLVHFSPTGAAYSLVCGSQVTMHGTSGDAGVLASLTHQRRVLCQAQQHDDVLLTGVEDGSVKVWDLRSSCVQHTLDRAHASRVRSMAIVDAGDGKVPRLFATASSDGIVKVWDSRMLSSLTGQAAQCVAQAATNARITCLCAHDPDAAPAQAPKPKPAKPPTPASVKKDGTSPAIAKPISKKPTAKPTGKASGKAAAKIDDFEVVPGADGDDDINLKQEERQQGQRQLKFTTVAHKTPLERSGNDQDHGQQQQQQQVKKQKKRTHQAALQSSEAPGSDVLATAHQPAKPAAGMLQQQPNIQAVPATKKAKKQHQQQQQHQPQRQQQKEPQQQQPGQKASKKAPATATAQARAKQSSKVGKHKRQHKSPSGQKHQRKGPGH